MNRIEWPGYNKIPLASSPLGALLNLVKDTPKASQGRHRAATSSTFILHHQNSYRTPHMA